MYIKQLPIFVLTLFIMFSLSSCKKKEVVDNTNKTQTISNKTQQATPTLKIYKPKVIRSFPHDSKAYTQGLFIDEGYLYESTGQHGMSSLRKIDITTGNLINKKDIDGKYFSEGITLFQNNIYMLTWQSRKGFIFDKNTFEQKAEFSYFSEGWGITSDNEYIYMSDGSEYLRVINSDGFSVNKTLTIKYNGQNISRLNELEIVGDTIYANLYMYDAIARINKHSGEVFDIIDCSELRSMIGNSQTAEALNGIAYNKDTKTFILTGKNWDTYFEVKFETKGLYI